jgi:hypothetical protein
MTIGALYVQESYLIERVTKNDDGEKDQCESSDRVGVAKLGWYLIAHHMATLG